jgi:hypothetical protein
MVHKVIDVVDLIDFFAKENVYFLHGHGFELLFVCFEELDGDGIDD